MPAESPTSRTGTPPEQVGSCSPTLTVWIKAPRGARCDAGAGRCRLGAAHAGRGTVDLAVADDGLRHTVRRQQLPPLSPPEEPPPLSPPENHPPPLEPLSQEAPPSPPAVALGPDDTYADEPRRIVGVRRRTRNEKVRTIAPAAANSPKKISMSTTVWKPINFLRGLHA